MAESKIGYGALFKVENASTPGTYDTVGEITSIKPPGVSAEILDRTTMQSPNKTKQKLGGLREWGQASVNVNFDPSDTTGHMALQAKVGETANYQIEFPDGETWDFPAIASNWEPGEVTPAGIMTASFTVDLDGEPTFNPAP